MLRYADLPEWADIEPLPQDDGPGQPLAAITYTEDYSEAMSYLRAVMAKNEMSERVLGLTDDIIHMNPAHYTVWLYRARVVFNINRDLREEIDWLNPTALQHLKNYQIWHHRQTIIDRLDSAEGEQDFIAQMFALDAKNYHVWSYRQWLVQRFGLWDKDELEAVEELLTKDVRNNSAWNHRLFIAFGKDEKLFGDKDIVQRELEYAKSAIRLAPQNQSPWNYIRGISRQAKGPAALPLSSLKAFASTFASLDAPNEIQSSHALDVLAEIFAQEDGKTEEAVKALDLLARKYDPIRANYWNYRKSLLPDQVLQAVA